MQLCNHKGTFSLVKFIVWTDEWRDLRYHEAVNDVNMTSKYRMYRSLRCNQSRVKAVTRIIQQYIHVVYSAVHDPR